MLGRKRLWLASLAPFGFVRVIEWDASWWLTGTTVFVRGGGEGVSTVVMTLEHALTLLVLTPNLRNFLVS